MSRAVTAMDARNAPDFDLYQFEDRIEELLLTVRRLRVENRTLRGEWEEQLRLNAELKQRLESIVERIRRIEQAEAKNGQPASAAASM